METISNVAAAASKAIFGEAKTTNETAGQEPVSGEQGRGTPNEPFDKGNSDPITGDNSTQTTSAKNNETGGREPISGEHGSGTLNEPFDKGNSENPVTGDKSTSAIGDHTTSLAAHNSSSLTGANPTSVSDNPPMLGDGTNDKHTPNTSTEPSTIPSSTTETPSEFKLQGADKPSAAPTGPEETTAIKEKKDDAEEALKRRGPNDHSGEPMRMHDGPEKVPSTQEERRTSKAGNPGGQEHGKEPKGTGEQWVKSSGMAAEGGDFDATKPGAGREADRLLEQKGIKKGDTGQFESATGGEAPSSTGGAGTGEHKEKEKLSDKLKAKLHIGHRNKDKESK